MEDLSIEAAEIFEDLLQNPLIDIESLSFQLMAYQEQLREEIAQSEFVDEELAETIYARAMELLERIASDYDEHDHTYAQAAVFYYMELHDEEQDLGSPVGFDDDRDVFNAVVTELGHDDLIIGF